MKKEGVPSPPVLIQSSLVSSFFDIVFAKTTPPSLMGSRKDLKMTFYFKGVQFVSFSTFAI